jgi:hypothetical protein
VIQHDTIVYEKYFTSKDTVIYYKDVYVPRTIREIRVENKLIRDTIRIKERANVQIAKEETKQTKAENNVFSKFFVGLAIGLSIALMLYFANKLKR